MTRHLAYHGRSCAVSSVGASLRKGTFLLHGVARAAERVVAARVESLQPSAAIGLMMGPAWDFPKTGRRLVA